MLQWINYNNRKFLKTTAIWGIAVVFFVFLFSFAPVHAQNVGGPVDSGTLGNEYAGQIGLAGTDIRLVIANVVRVALGLVGLIMVILMLYAGYLWMTSGGNEEQVTKAKSIIKNAVIGLAIVLASYSIVLFVMNLFGIGKGVGGDAMVDVTGPNTQNFQGSGGLGTVIKDHYPMRSQEDVPRNTKIVVTFRRPVKLSSFVDDTNRNGVFGDCKETIVNWSEDCDQLKKGTDGKLSNDYVNISKIVTNAGVNTFESFLPGVAVIATSTEVGNVKGVYTVVFRPNEYLGSTSEKYVYVVRLGRSILLDDQANRDPSAFSVKIMGNDYYEWQFSCSTVMDYDPPRVISVFPEDGSQDYINTALQINFNEPMDPTGLQGEFAVDGDYYYLQGKNIFLKTKDSNLPAGSFNIVNNYQTLEFIPSRVCGENGCGGKRYCMNVCDKNGGVGCSKIEIGREKERVNNELFNMVIKAASTINANSFEAQPFTGAMDLAGNALDSEPYGQVNAVPVNKSKPTDVGFFANNPDNFVWSFHLMDKIYDQAPIVRQVTPGISAENVKARQDWKMDFAGVMLFDSLYSIDIQQYTNPPQTVPLCKSPRATYDLTNKMTSVNMFHCSFLDGRPITYMPSLTSDLMEVHFNCFNPGNGPKGTVRQMESLVCDNTEANRANCCAVVKDTNLDFCCNGEVGDSKDTAVKCAGYLQN